MRPMDVRGGAAAQGGNRVHAGHEVSRSRSRMKMEAAVCHRILKLASFLKDKVILVIGLISLDADLLILLPIHVFLKRSVI
jgi:hypothetical protein